MHRDWRVYASFLLRTAQPDRGSGPSNIWKEDPGNKDINHTVVQFDLLIEAELQADVIQLLVDHKEGAWILAIARLAH